VLDINAMLLFARVVMAQSYTQAAKNTGIPKSTLSRKIAQLEKQLDVRLLQRNSRAISLTEEGRQVYERALTILQEVESVQLALEIAQQGVSGTLRVLFPIAFDQATATSLCTGFMKKYPKVDVAFQFSAEDIDIVGQNFDIAVMFGPLASSNLIARPLFERDRVLVASPSYLKTYGNPLDAASLSGHRGILLGNSNSLPIWPLGLGANKSLVTFNPRACVNSAAAVKQLVLADMGIAILSDAQCRAELEHGDMVALLTNYPLEKLTAYGLYSSRSQLAPRISCFLDYITQSFDRVESQQFLQLSPVKSVN